MQFNNLSGAWPLRLASVQATWQTLLMSESSKGPRRRLGREERQQALIEAAFEEFVQKGYDGARLKDIAERAGAAPGLLNFYFESKEKLFQSVVAQYLAPNLLADVDRSLKDTQGSAEVLLKAALQSIYSNLVNDRRGREILRLIIAEGPRFPELGQAYFQQMMTDNVRIIRDVIQLGVERGEFRPEAAEGQARLVHAPAAGALLWAMIFGEHNPLDVEAWMAAHLDLVLTGIRIPRAETDSQP
jgi:AcrR family transcriptional regulator